jgi:glycine cleavage system T protein
VTASNDSPSTADSSSTDERLSPLHAIHVAAGASFTDFAGWQMPVSYGSDLAEHHAVRAAAALFDLSHMGEIFVVGPEAAAALDYALAGKLSAIAVGQAKYSLLLNPEGGIVDDLVVYRTGDDRFLVVANASNRVDVARELLARSESFDCEVYDESDDIALIAIQGPRAYEILSQTPGVEISDLEELKYYWTRPGTFGDRGEHELLVARTGYTGEDGFELYLAPDAAAQLWEALMETGAGSGLIAAGLASRDTLRLEAGMPLYGHELGRRDSAAWWPSARKATSSVAPPSKRDPPRAPAFWSASPRRASVQDAPTTWCTPAQHPPALRPPATHPPAPHLTSPSASSPAARSRRPSATPSRWPMSTPRTPRQKPPCSSTYAENESPPPLYPFPSTRESPADG